MPTPPFKILVSCPSDNVLSPAQLEIKQYVVDQLCQSGFEPQIFGELGLPISEPWTFDNVRAFVARCQGAVILGLSRFALYDQQQYLYNVPTEYNHFEGAMAIARQLPTLIISENGLMPRGIFNNGAGRRIVKLPLGANPQMLQSDRLYQSLYQDWGNKVNNRFHLFLGYSSKAIGTAAQIKNFLNGSNVRVLDWATNFGSGTSILTEIEKANSTCLGGLFLFTKDDELISGDTSHAAPRDNVVFEAGYFMSSKSDERVLIILEEGAKIPADLGGAIYLMLKDRNDISTIQTKLLKWVNDRL